MRNGHEYVDYKTSRMLRDLNFKGDTKLYYSRDSEILNGQNACEDHNHNGTSDLFSSAPLWQQVEEWIWNKLQIYISVNQRQENDFYFQVIQEADVFIEERNFDTPIQAKIEGMKSTVKYLWEDKLK